MAFTESSHPPQANSLVSFLDTASKTINGLMDKSSKGNKRRVNHKKYLQKRLQRKPLQPKAAKQTKSKSAQLPSAALVTQQPGAGEAPASGVPPFVHHNSWSQLPGYLQAPKPTTQLLVEPDIDFLLQQLSSTASEMPPQPIVSRSCSESSFYPISSFAPPQPQPVVSLESQVLIAEQPYGSPYTPSNSSVDDFFEDSAYSSPSSSIHSSPATVSLAHEWSPPTTAVSACIPTTTAECWGLQGVPTPSCMVSCSDWLSVTSSPALSTMCPITMDQRLPTVPQLWDQLAYSEQVPY